jgi:hypothetical protein
MKLSFCSISSLCHLLLVTTVASIALSHSVEVLAKTQTPFQVPAQLNYPVGKAAEGRFARQNIVQQLRQREIAQKKSDNPAPIPGSPGGSR